MYPVDDAPYGGGPIKFFKILDQWRAEGNFEGLEMDGNELASQLPG